MSGSLLFFLADSEAMTAFGTRLATCCQRALTIFLCGDLGAGKTTIARGLLHGAGHAGAVRSPTYTLVEPYPDLTPPVYHFDLYRLADPEELEFLGIRDYFDGRAICLVEWPERGEGVLPPADLTLAIRYAGQGREVRCVAETASGTAVLACLAGG